MKTLEEVLKEIDRCLLFTLSSPGDKNEKLFNLGKRYAFEHLQDFIHGKDTGVWTNTMLEATSLLSERKKSEHCTHSWRELCEICGEVR